MTDIDFFRQLTEAWKIISTPFLEMGDAKISLWSLIVSTAIILVAIRLSKILSHWVRKILESKAVDSGVQDSIGRFISIGVMALGVIMAMDVMGISLSSLAALGAVLMVGIGFGLQNITQNFISGLIILIERPVKIGDVVKLGFTSGKVVEIRVRSTVIQTRDDVSIIVPNSKIIAEEVINESFPSSRIRLHVAVGVAYGSDLATVQKVLLEAAKNHRLVLPEPSPVAVFQSFSDSSLDFDLRFWTEELWDSDLVASEVRLKIDSLFREHQIQIPFPQRDVHLKQG